MVIVLSLLRGFPTPVLTGFRPLNGKEGAVAIIRQLGQGGHKGPKALPRLALHSPNLLQVQIISITLPVNKLPETSTRARCRRPNKDSHTQPTRSLDVAPNQGDGLVKKTILTFCDANHSNFMVAQGIRGATKIRLGASTVLDKQPSQQVKLQIAKFRVKLKQQGHLDRCWAVFSQQFPASPDDWRSYFSECCFS